MNPTIAVWNKATVPLGLDLAALVAALQQYVNTCVQPAWGTGCTLTLGDGPIPGAWGIVFLDNADAPDALAYHEDVNGLPLAKVFVKTILDDQASVSVAASHELAEMLVDPDCNTLRHFRRRILYAQEVCDPCEEAPFVMIGDVPCSNFVWPAWFRHSSFVLSVQLDQLGLMTEPFSLLPGGYQSIYNQRTGQWSEIFGSQAKALRFAAEDRRDHRSEWRKA